MILLQFASGWRLLGFLDQVVSEAFQPSLLRLCLDGFYYGIAGWLLARGASMSVTVLDPESRVVSHHRRYLGFFTGRRRRWAFRDIRYVDLRHPLGTSFESNDEKEGRLIPYELVLRMEDWTDLMVCRSLNRQKVAELGARISQMTKKPLT